MRLALSRILAEASPTAVPASRSAASPAASAILARLSARNVCSGCSSLTRSSADEYCSSVVAFMLASAPLAKFELEQHVLVARLSAGILHSTERVDECGAIVSEEEGQDGLEPVGGGERFVCELRLRVSLLGAHVADEHERERVKAGL
eukprot:scaffold97022_cov26-Tisochrysis_lutea.AAC.3